MLKTFFSFSTFQKIWFFFFLYFFNLLYYVIYKKNFYKTIKLFLLKKEFFQFLKYIYYFFIVYILFFYMYYFILFFKYIEIYYLRHYIKNKPLLFLFLIQLHFKTKVSIYQFMLNIKNKNNKNFLYKYFKYNITYNLLYIYYLLYHIYIIYYNNYYIWWYTYFVRYYYLVKDNEKYTIKYNINILKNKYILKKNNVQNNIKNKFKGKTKYLKMSVIYYYHKNKRSLNVLFNKILYWINYIVSYIKSLYYFYFINFIFYWILKNNGTLIIYYIFVTLKNIKSIIIYLWHKYFKWKK